MSRVDELTLRFLFTQHRKLCQVELSVFSCSFALKTYIWKPNFLNRSYVDLVSLTHYLPVASYDTGQTIKTLPTNGNVHANFLHYSGNLAAVF